MRKEHYCDKCGAMIALKYRHCRKCSYGRQQEFRGRKELLKIRAQMRAAKKLRLDIRLQKLPAKNREKSKIVEALLRGESAEFVLQNRSNAKMKTVLRGC